MADHESLPQTAAEGKTTTTTTMKDAWDYKGRPAVRASSGGWSSAAMILVVELNERLTTLGVAVNLVTYLIDTMHLGGAASANAVTNFLGASFMLCLLGGFVADTYLGRYLTIAIFTAVQAVGMCIYPDRVDGGSRAAAAGVRGPHRPQPQQQLRGAQRYAAGRAVPGPVPDGAGHGGSQVQRVGVRVRPVRRVGRRRAAEHGALLQLVLLLHQHRVAAGGDGAGVRAGPPGPALGLRRLRGRHPGRPAALPRRHTKVPVQEAGGEPADADRGGDGGGVEEARDAAAVGPGDAVRRGRCGGRRRGRQGKAQDAAHQAMQVPGEGGDRGGGGGGGGGGGFRFRQRQEEVGGVHADGRGGGEAGGADAPDVGHHHPLLDRLRPDDHLLRLPGAGHGPPPWLLLRDPRRLPHRLLRRLHPPHRHRAPRPPPHRQPAGPLPAAAHLRRPPPLRARHGRRRAHRARPPDGLPRRRHALRLPARAAVLPRRRRGGLHLRRPARLLPARVPQGNEDHEHGALPQHALARLLLQHRHRQRRARRHHLRRRRAEALAHRRPRPGQPRQILLAAGRHQRRQPAGLRGRGQGTRLQGEAPGGGGHPPRRPR